MGGGAVASDDFLWVTASSMRYGAAAAASAHHQEPLDLRAQGSESPLDGPWLHHGLGLNRRGADYADAHLHPCHPALHQVIFFRTRPLDLFHSSIRYLLDRRIARYLINRTRFFYNQVCIDLSLTRYLTQHILNVIK